MKRRRISIRRRFCHQPSPSMPAINRVQTKKNRFKYCLQSRRRVTSLTSAVGVPHWCCFKSVTLETLLTLTAHTALVLIKTDRCLCVGRKLDVLRRRGEATQRVQHAGRCDLVIDGAQQYYSELLKYSQWLVWKSCTCMSGSLCVCLQDQALGAEICTGCCQWK